MHLVIWILITLALGAWSLLAWGAWQIVTLSPGWSVEWQVLVDDIPYAEIIDRWFPGWQELLRVLLELTDTALGWLGTAAPLVVWLVWGVGALLLLGGGAVLSLVVMLLRPKPAPAAARG